MTPNNTTALDTAIELSMYRTMSTIKQTDERLRALLMSGQLAVAYYSPRGQEAVSAGVGAALASNDYVVTTYRGLHDHIAKGVPLPELIAEIMGKVTGTCKGKGGGMHVTHPASGLMITTGIVGAGMPIANGLAFSSKFRGDGRVTVVNFGDGASNIGAFHEALNLASLWKLPVVFVCQNNRYAEHSAFAVGTSVPRVSDRAASYSMPGITVDGNDPIAVYRAAADAVARARAGEGPTLLEAVTFRFMGHFFGDGGAYIPPEEMAEAQANDPVPAYRGSLIERGIAGEGALDEIDASVAAVVAAAVDFAVNSAYPDPEVELHTDVFAQRVRA
jgi:acetoin:2,6-dichlorophenolindophenol oxidoreductase subunit alpha